MDFWIGIAIGVFFLLALIIACCCCCENRSTQKVERYEKLESAHFSDSCILKIDSHTFDEPKNKYRNCHIPHSFVEEENKERNYYVSKVCCQRCSKSFRHQNELDNHLRQTDGKCRYKEYAKVKLSRKQNFFILQECEKANLHKDAYENAKDVVFNVLSNILQNTRNGGRFDTWIDREGSTKTGLKTRKPNEFDFTIRVLLSGSPDIVFSFSKPGEVSVFLSERDASRFRNCCEERKLSPVALREMFHQFVREAVFEMGNNETQVSVGTAPNGPAVKLTIRHYNIKHRIDVDLTPKIAVHSYQLDGMCVDMNWPRKETYKAFSQEGIDQVLEQDLYLVAKGYEFWTVSLANYENALLQIFPNGSVEKKLFRYMKIKLEAWQTRNPELRKQLSSYIVKEIFFWLRENLPDPELWKGSKCAERYYNFLQEMKYCFENHHLKDYFLTDKDLLKGKDDSLKKALNEIEKEMYKLRQDKSELFCNR